MVQVTEQTVLIVVASRSEVIKMAPIYLSCKRAHIPVVLCATNCSPSMQQVLDLFIIKPDIIISHENDNKDFLTIFQYILENIQPIIKKIQPFLVVIHGDSVSSMAVAMAAFYHAIPVAHVEAGLRADDLHSPFPDEMQRRVITAVSTFHFAPTMSAVANILTQGVRRDHIFCTGNTGVDALMIIKEKIMHKEIVIDHAILDAIATWRHNDVPIGLITLGDIEHTQQEKEILFSLINKVDHCAWIIVCDERIHHENLLHQLKNCKGSLVMHVDALSYKEMVYVLDNVDIILTDSGVIQEEAVSLSKPVLILRHKTEYMEGVLAHQAQVVGFSPLLIMNGIEQILHADHRRSPHVQQLYGDGHAAEKIVAFIQVRYSELKHSAFMHDDNYYQQKEVE